MANAIYPLYKQSVLSADANSDLLQTTANVAPYVAMVNTSSYTYSGSHQYYSSLAGVVGTDQQITSPAATNGTFSGGNVTFTSVTGSTVGALVVYRKNAGANTTWRLVMYEDTSVTGLPVTPNGGNIVITWNGSGIFTISDDKLKEDVLKIGKRGPLNVYSYRYRGSDKRTRGHMASEVAKFAPHAVRRGAHGHLEVNYSAIAEALAA
jgi:hypothetical protein